MGSWGWSSGSDVHWLFLLGRGLVDFDLCGVEMSISVTVLRGTCSTVQCPLLRFISAMLSVL
uniref:Uncharacterized protein n=1 Tax=Arundo donax TaxID=35708 RepID=A0A0A9HCH7_ARUDO